MDSVPAFSSFGFGDPITEIPFVHAQPSPSSSFCSNQNLCQTADIPVIGAIAGLMNDTNVNYMYAVFS
jgi:hypothetical protein